MSKLKLEDLFFRKVELEEGFTYKSLYNDDTRGAVHKGEHKTILRSAISKGVIKVEKYIVAENVQEDLYKIVDESKGSLITLIESLKEYHSESSFVIAPLIYLLKLIDPNYTIKEDENIKIHSNVTDFLIRPRVDGANASPRLFMPSENIALTTTNDDVENLGDILITKDIEVYIIGIDSRSDQIWAYKIIKDERFSEGAKKYLKDQKDIFLDMIR